jgi:uncharacterized membrane protein
MPSNTPRPRTNPSQGQTPESGLGGDAAPEVGALAIPPPPLETRPRSEVAPVQLDHQAARGEVASRAERRPIHAGDIGRVATASGVSATAGNPRFRALLSYAVPFAPALVVLLHERRNAFVRLHAARALAFYGLIGVAQIVLFVALVLIGGFALDGIAAIAFGLLFYGLFGLLGIAAVGVWLRLLADAAAGTLTPVPLLTAAARRIEWGFARLQRRPV